MFVKWLKMLFFDLAMYLRRLFFDGGRKCLCHYSLFPSSGLETLVVEAPASFPLEAGASSPWVSLSWSLGTRETCSGKCQALCIPVSLDFEHHPVEQSYFILVSSSLPSRCPLYEKSKALHPLTPSPMGEGEPGFLPSPKFGRGAGGEGLNVEGIGCIENGEG